MNDMVLYINSYSNVTQDACWCPLCLAVAARGVVAFLSINHVILYVDVAYWVSNTYPLNTHRKLR